MYFSLLIATLDSGRYISGEALILMNRHVVKKEGAMYKEPKETHVGAKSAPQHWVSHSVSQQRRIGSLHRSGTLAAIEASTGLCVWAKSAPGRSPVHRRQAGTFPVTLGSRSEPASEAGCQDYRPC